MDPLTFNDVQNMVNAYVGDIQGLSSSIPSGYVQGGPSGQNVYIPPWLTKAMQGMIQGDVGWAQAFPGWMRSNVDAFANSIGANTADRGHRAADIAQYMVGLEAPFSQQIYNAIQQFPREFMPYLMNLYGQGRGGGGQGGYQTPIPEGVGGAGGGGGRTGLNPILQRAGLQPVDESQAWATGEAMNQGAQGQGYGGSQISGDLGPTISDLGLVNAYNASTSNPYSSEDYGALQGASGYDTGLTTEPAGGNTGGYSSSYPGGSTDPGFYDTGG